MFCHLLFQDLNYLKILNFNFPLLSEPCPDLLTPGGYRGKVVLINFWHMTNESSVIARIWIQTYLILPVSEHIQNNTKPNNTMKYLQYQRIPCNTCNTMQYRTIWQSCFPECICACPPQRDQDLCLEIPTQFSANRWLAGERTLVLRL